MELILPTCHLSNSFTITLPYPFPLSILMEKTAEISKSNSFGADEMRGNGLKGLIKTLPRKMAWNGFPFYQYQGCWIPSPAVQGIISFHRNFLAKATDLLLCTLPKSGTTWLKALAFSIVNRDHYAPAQTPLPTSSPHALVPCGEFHLFENDQKSINLNGLASPRIFATHAPYNYDFVVMIEYKRRA
ncbi:cytosolic sulfotransferase 15-like [Vitis riparia]|uniref:cytosolic sulfotransferase 15-like n=1 Tax=Vitis riparia TaxID=96939 RepID=UPI00155B3973|nr:cytosolic sulfotransferase 15-like [Vitis riparia]